MYRLLLCLALFAAACGPVTSTDVRVSGSGAVGVSSGGTSVSYFGGGGPPPGRTAAERQARKDYYRGPRGQEF